jgi:2-polyprenyl-3-methyl-5-hydroxy-6-metoxy-1,4-benzoquinol methylase
MPIAPYCPSSSAPAVANVALGRRIHAGGEPVDEAGSCKRPKILFSADLHLALGRRIHAGGEPVDEAGSCKRPKTLFSADLQSVENSPEMTISALRPSTDRIHHASSTRIHEGLPPRRLPEGMSIESIKAEIASQLMADLRRVQISLRGKTVLDVGSGLGFNAKAMQMEGASVFGVEPDAVAHAQAISRSNLVEAQAYHGRLQDMPGDMYGKFDVATVFLWNIPYAERDDVMKSLCAVLKPDGGVIIGMYDNEYISAPHGLMVQPLAKRYFAEVHATPINDLHVNRQLLICSSPRSMVLST